jgi:ComF family protein
VFVWVDGLAFFKAGRLFFIPFLCNLMAKKRMLAKLWITDFVNLFFPNNCSACGNSLVSQEEVICTGCQFKLPRTNFHFEAENPIARIFWGRVNLESATSFLFFNKGGNVQQLVHQLKYKGKKNVGRFMGSLFGNDLLRSPVFASVDLIVPVPLHPKKERLRGFNQSKVIAHGLSESLQKPLSTNNLVRLVHTSSQTKKSRYSRWENVKDVFGIKDPSLFAGKHILLVDDVLTTGATMEACAQKILEVEGAKVSAVTLAYAQV